VTRHVAAIIPARGGSKRIPQKNLTLLAGRPLVVHTIEAARKSGLVDSVYVSTDDQTIAAVAREAGAEVIRRPAAMAADDSPSEMALLHAVQTIEIVRREKTDVLVMLQPTSPLRTHVHIDEAVNQLLATGCDSVVSVLPEIHYYFLGDVGAEGQFTVGYDPLNRLRTQEIPPRYRENGAIYVFTRELFLSTRCRMGRDMRAYVMDAQSSIDVDSAEDLLLCQLLLQKQALGADISGIAA
jgi:CMP-N,N'-diacetyllegionaminic acid synthase